MKRVTVRELIHEIIDRQGYIFASVNGRIVRARNIAVLESLLDVVNSEIYVQGCSTECVALYGIDAELSKHIDLLYNPIPEILDFYKIPLSPDVILDLRLRERDIKLLQLLKCNNGRLRLHEYLLIPVIDPGEHAILSDIASGITRVTGARVSVVDARNPVIPYPRRHIYYDIGNVL